MASALGVPPQRVTPLIESYTGGGAAPTASASVAHGVLSTAALPTGARGLTDNLAFFLRQLSQGGGADQMQARIIEEFEELLAESQGKRSFLDRLMDKFS